MSVRDTEQLKVLMQILSDDLAFYQDASVKAQRPEHQAIFGRMAKARAFAMDYLSPFLQQGTEDGEHTFGSLLHKMYPEILSGLDSSVDVELIEQSAEVEKRTLKAMRKALADIESPLIRAIIKDVCPMVNGDYYSSYWHKAS